MKRIVTLIVAVCIVGAVTLVRTPAEAAQNYTNTVKILDDYTGNTTSEQEELANELQSIKAEAAQSKPVEQKPAEPIDPYTYTPMKMLYQTSAKTYMDYRAITNKSSAQYKLIHSDQIEICEDGFLRDSEGYIGVAMGSYFGPIGSRYICHLDNGKTIKVIKVEAKADQHAISGFCGYVSYDILEFVIDTKAQWMQNNKWGNGYIFSGNFNNYESFKGKIVSIDKVVLKN